MNTPKRLCTFALGFCLLVPTLAPAANDVVLRTDTVDYFYAYGVDQPELYMTLFDPRTGEYLSDPDSSEPVFMQTFIDTGASGFVISNMHAEGYQYDYMGPREVPSVGLDGSPSGEFIGEFSEVGIGGSELGDVTQTYDVRIQNGSVNGLPGLEEFLNIEYTLDGMTSYGEHNLWVRREPGVGETIPIETEEMSLELADPVNVAGMPVISQRVMVMDATTLDPNSTGRVTTQLLEAGDPNIPNTNITLDAHLVDLTGPAPEGEVLPSQHANPMIRNISISHNDGTQRRTSAENEWLFDTGSSGSFLSFAKAQEVGLIDSAYASFDDFMAVYTGMTGAVGGIGPNQITVPVLELDEIRIGAKEGFDLVWNDVQVMVVDIEPPADGEDTLQGVLGMNLLLPTMEIDMEDPLGFFEQEMTPGYFEDIVFDSTDPNNVELRLSSTLVPEPTSMMLFALGAVAIVRRRR